MLTSQYTSLVQNQLANFATQDNFGLVITTAFGNNFDLSQLADLRQQWLTGNFSVIPPIQVLTEGELLGANGAYAAELDRIFISSDFLATASEASITSVLLEEVGHRIDRLLNGSTDSAGDEGEIFSALARGIDLSPETLALLKVQNDHAVITVGGRSIAVEESVFTGTDEGNDTYGGSPADDLIYGYGGNDTLFGADGNDTIYGGFSNYVGNDDDSINGGYGSDSIFGANGNDSIDAGDDFLFNFVSGGAGNDTILGSFGSDFLEGDSQFYSAEFGNDFINGYSGVDTIIGGPGDDTIFGGSDNDLIYGNSGINSLYGEDGLDTIYSGSAYENGVGTGITSGVIDGGMGGDFVYGDNKNDSINGGDGNDNIFGGGGNDTLIGSVGDDNVYGDNGNDSIEGSIGNDFLVGDDGDDTIYGDDGNDTINGGSGNDELLGGNGDDYISGGSGNDFIYVNFLTNGNDTVDGGIGDDRYLINGGNISNNFTIIEPTNGGTDTLRFFSGVNINLSVNTVQTLYPGILPVAITLSGSLDNIENIEIVNGTGIFAGNASSVLTGNALNNFIDGGNGNDGIAGGSGSDTINGNDGDDLLSGGLDADLIKGGNGNDLIFGDGFFPGNSNDTLDGGAGNNTLNGGGGDDVFIIYDYVNGSAINALGENTNGGIDTISIIAAGVNPISLDLSATATQTVAIGNQLTASSLANIENITLSAPSSVDGYLSGNSLNNVITSGGGNDTLIGAEGIDTLNGGTGSDVYGIYNSNTVTNEDASSGIDTVWTAVNYTLAANVENLALIGSNALIGNGNDLDNMMVGYGSENHTLYGLGGNDTLINIAGIDTLYGGTGDDFYLVNNSVTVINENPAAGQDTVWSTVSYTLADNVENLYLAGAINGTGNNLANLISGYFGVSNHTISGLEGNDTLIGGIARDQLSGGADDDIYGIYNSSTVVIENANEGTDTVWAAVDFSLTANVENLYLVGDTAGIGNDLANTIVGYGTGNNTIDGGAGADNLWGGAGADTFVLRNPNDGIDTINEFEAGTDKFNLVGDSFGGTSVVGAAGVLAAAKFAIGTTAITVDQRFIYDNTSGALYFDADGSGSSLQVLIAQLNINLSLTNTSFSLV